jgi:hypothetical protein
MKDMNKWIVEKFEQSHTRTPHLVGSEVFDKEEDAIAFYKRAKRCYRWPWVFWAYPKKVEQQLRKAKVYYKTIEELQQAATVLHKPVVRYKDQQEKGSMVQGETADYFFVRERL